MTRQAAAAAPRKLSGEPWRRSQDANSASSCCPSPSQRGSSARGLVRDTSSAAMGVSKPYAGGVGGVEGRRKEEGEEAKKSRLASKGGGAMWVAGFKVGNKQALPRWEPCQSSFSLSTAFSFFLF